MDRFKGDDFRHRRINLLQKFLQMFWVVMTEDVLRGTAGTYTMDHRGMVALVREDVHT